MTRLYLGIIFLLFMLSGCGPHSLEDFREEGEGVTRTLIQELQKIHTRDELLAASGRLQRLFDNLANIMVAAEDFCCSFPDQDNGEFVRCNHELSDQLRIELNRLYRLEGGRQVIEKCQENALHRLDATKKLHNH